MLRINQYRFIEVMFSSKMCMTEKIFAIITHTESLKKISWDYPLKSDTHAHFIDLSRCYVFWKEGRPEGRKGLSPPINGGSPASKHGIYLSSELRLLSFNIYPFWFLRLYTLALITFKGIDRSFELRGGVRLIRSVMTNWRLGNFFYVILKGLHHKISKKAKVAA